MKVLILTPAFPPEITGSGHLMFELAESLSKKGHVVTVITAIPRQRMGVQGRGNVYIKRLLIKEKIGEINILRPKILTLPLSSPLAKGIDHFLLALSYYWAGRRVGRQDVVMVYSPPLLLGLTGIRLAKKFQSPLVFNAQDMFPRYAVDTGVLKNRFLIRFFTRIEEYVYTKATGITVHSSGNREYLVSRGIDAKKIDIIPNWVDTKRFHPGQKANEIRKELGLEKSFLVSYCGTIGWAQGLDIVIESARLLRNRSGIIFLIVGDGPRRKEYENTVLREKLNNIRFVQLLPRDKYARLLQASDICLISLHSNISTPVVPGKLFDIMATGRPVVANIPSSSDACEIIKISQCGICVSPDRPRELSEAILRLSDNPAEADRMGKDGRQYAEQHFSRENCTGQYERLFTRLTDNP